MSLLVQRFHRHVNHLAHQSTTINHQNLAQLVCSRHLFGFSRSSASKRKKYSERRVLGWSQERLYEIVANVDDYNKFLPACYKSVVTERRADWIKADLEIGLPPLLIERYTSHVTLDKPNLVRAACFKGKLFEHLDTEWKFSEGLADNSNTCTLDFKLDFEFRSQLYSQVANSVFDELVRQTVNAFTDRARELYGPPQFIPPNLSRRK